MTGGAREEPENRETTGGAPENPGGRREMPDEGKEGGDMGKGKPRGEKDMADAEEVTPDEEGKREEPEEDEGIDKTAEDNPERKTRDPKPSTGHKPTGSTEGLATPTNSLKAQSNGPHPGRDPDPPNAHRQHGQTLVNPQRKIQQTAIPWSIETTR